MTIEEKKQQIREIFNHYLEAIDCVDDEAETVYDEEFDETYEVTADDKIADLVVNCAGECLEAIAPMEERGEEEEECCCGHCDDECWDGEEECCCGHHHGHHHHHDCDFEEMESNTTDAYIEAYIDGVRATLNSLLKIDQDDYSYNRDREFEEEEEECCCGHHHHGHHHHHHCCEDEESCCCEHEAECDDEIKF